VGTVVITAQFRNTTQQRAVVFAAGARGDHHGADQSAAHRRRFNTPPARSTNFGTIVSTTAALRDARRGVYLGAGGLITNAAGASINAVRAAVSLAFFGTTSRGGKRWSNAGTLNGRDRSLDRPRRHRQQHDRQFRRDYRYPAAPPFASASGMILIVLESGSSLQGVITGFHSRRPVRPAVPAFSASGTVTLDASTHVLQIVENAGTYTINLDPSQSFAGEPSTCRPMRAVVR